eukprot:GSChrysophyteH2.ASY1.ANO1.1315.1 assembled CDS
MPSRSTTVSSVLSQKTMQDLIKGMRSNKGGETTSEFISMCIAEIKEELTSTDPFTKAEAIRKLTFLQMQGYDISWAAFAIVEVMGQPRFAHKRIGYLAANQSFTDTTDVMLLTTNNFKKEFSSSSSTPYDIGSASAVIAMCSEYLKGFIEDKDPNLKYLGLVGLVTLMPTAPRVVVQHREIILHCLNDDDVTIRTRALELLSGIVSKKSLRDLVHHLLEHIKYADGQYKEEIIKKVLYMCMKDKYALLVDFAWYCSILINLATTQGTKHGRQVADQLVEVALRVEFVRPYK